MNTRNLRSTLIGSLGVALALASGSALATSFRLTDLGAVGNDAGGVAINASGQATCTFTIDGYGHAVMWDGTTLHDLGTLGGTRSGGSDINDAGQVTGYAFRAEDATNRAFLWDGTTMKDLGALGGRFANSQGLAINASGQVTGGAATRPGFRGQHPFLWDGTRMQDLGTLGGGGVGLAINDAGQVTGYDGTVGGETHAFLWDGTTIMDLGTLGGTYSAAHAINASGQAMGNARTADENYHAILWDGTTLQDLGTLGGRYSFGADINDSGQVTGVAETAAGAVHVFLWDGTTMLDLGTLRGTFYSEARAINASGEVTGSANAGFGTVDRAFLWDGTRMQDLNALIDPTDPLQPFAFLEFGVDINDLGQILANGFDSRTGQRHAYVVSPIAAMPESGTLALLGLGLAGLGFTRRRRAA